MIFKVPYGQDPYSVIGKYIRDHITVIEDIIAVIKINEVETNQLFTVDTNEENYFIWETDWWEGEEDVALIDFFPVSEAQRANQSVQSADTISRQDAIDVLSVSKELLSRVLDDMDVVGTDREKYLWGLGMLESNIKDINDLPTAQPKTGTWIHCGWAIACSECNYDMPWAVRNYCPNCGARMKDEGRRLNGTEDTD